MSKLPKPKKKRFYRRWWFWTLLVVAVIVVLGGVAAAGAFQAAQRASLDYLEDTASAQRRTLVNTINADGEIKAEQSSVLAASLPAVVQDVNFVVGDDVNKDDVVVRTDGGVASDEELKAPFDGRVLSVNTFVDDAVTPGVPLVEIGFRSNVVEFIASESEVVELEVGQDVTITIPSDNGGKDEYAGEVTFVDVKKQIVGQDPTSGVTESGYVVRVSAGNIPEELRRVIGLSVDLKIDIDEADDVLSLEPSAIQYDNDDEPFVYLAPTLDDTFIQNALTAELITDVLQKREIEVGFEGDEYFEVTDGLRDNDNVLLYIPSDAR